MTLDASMERAIDLSVKIELAVGKLYMLFFQSLKEDATLWWTLANEENNHGSVLKTLRLMSETLEIPKDLFAKDIPVLEGFLTKCQGWIQKYQSQHPNREESFRIAKQAEISCAELTYQTFMTKKAIDPMAKMVQSINSEDRDHLIRLEEYAGRAGIRI
jgi:hypothetical protein